MFSSPFGKRYFPFEAIAAKFDFPADIHTDIPPVLSQTGCDSKWPLRQGMKLIISVQSRFEFLEPKSIVYFKIVWVFLALILDLEPVSLMLIN